MKARVPTQELSQLYHDGFYSSKHDTVLRSARIYLRHLWRYWQPRSVLDVGCGRGTWLKVCGELGTESLLGIDGPWNETADMVDGRIDFRPMDLTAGFRIPEAVDLVVTLEAAEHLPEASAEQFVESLAAASDTILFSAAFTDQGGTNHLNEQPHSYWARKFAERGFAPFDMFRPLFWGDRNVAFWYRQNTFLYARRECRSYQLLHLQGLRKIENLDFMDCIHPDRFIAKQAGDPPEGHVGFRAHAVELLPSLIRSLKARVVDGGKA